ncbi:MAG: ThiF family adenylyltransferase, partial [Hellea sp.]
MDDDYIERYSRQLILKEIGGPGQNLLSKARIAIIGAGGLGGPASMYLAAAGVGSM